MITLSYKGNPFSGVNLGNHLFVFASALGLAKRYNTSLAIPSSWRYLNSFTLLPEVKISDEIPETVIKEQNFHYDIEFFDQYKDLFQNKLVGIYGFLQSEKYWHNNLTEIRTFLKFSKDLSDRVYAEKKELITPDTVAISVRRGDFITSPNHYLLPFEYYIDALNEYFPHQPPIVIFTDDFKWCKKVFSRLPNEVHFADTYNNIEQLCFMSMFSNYIISNSTFSWWGAYLSNAEQKIVIKPYYVFDGHLKLTHDLRDHYPDKWLTYKHQEKKRNAIIKFLYYNDNIYKLKYFSKRIGSRILKRIPFLKKY